MKRLLPPIHPSLAEHRIPQSLSICLWTRQHTLHYYTILAPLSPTRKPLIIPLRFSWILCLLFILFPVGSAFAPRLRRCFSN